MIVIVNSSPLIALSRIDRLNILKELFGTILIPDSVYQETVLDANVIIQKENITKAVAEFIEVIRPQSQLLFTLNYSPQRSLRAQSLNNIK